MAFVSNETALRVQWDSITDSFSGVRGYAASMWQGADLMWESAPLPSDSWRESRRCEGGWYWGCCMGRRTVWRWLGRHAGLFAASSARFTTDLMPLESAAIERGGDDRRRQQR